MRYALSLLAIFLSTTAWAADMGPVPVDTAVEVPVNVAPIVDQTDGFTVETGITSATTGLTLHWNFVDTSGTRTTTAVTATGAGGNYDWTHKGNGMYEILIPASGGASANNDTEGYGWFTGSTTSDTLPFRGPVIAFGVTEFLFVEFAAPPVLEVPASSSKTYHVRFKVMDLDGTLTAPDADPTVTLYDETTPGVADDVTAAFIVDSTPAPTSTGIYDVPIVVESTDTNKLLRLEVTSIAKSGYTVYANAGETFALLPASPANFSALGIEADGDLTKVNTLDGHTAQTGDTFGALPTNFSATDINASGQVDVYQIEDVDATDQLDAASPSSGETLVWFVDADAAGTGDGKSWTNAFTTIIGAVGATNPGDIVIVDGDTFSEVTATLSVPGVRWIGYGATISHTAGGIPLTISGDCVTAEGFNLTTSGGATQALRITGDNVTAKRIVATNSSAEAVGGTSGLKNISIIGGTYTGEIEAAVFADPSGLTLDNATFSPTQTATADNITGVLITESGASLSQQTTGFEIRNCRVFATRTDNATGYARGIDVAGSGVIENTLVNVRQAGATATGAALGITDSNDPDKAQIYVQGGAINTFHANDGQTEFALHTANTGADARILYAGLVVDKSKISADSQDIGVHDEMLATVDGYTTPGQTAWQSFTVGDLSTTAKASVNAEVDTAFTDYDPPTRTELTNDLAALNDISPAEVNAELDTALVDYGALKPAVAGRDLAVNANGNAGIDWGNVDAPTTTINLSGTTVNLVNTVSTLTGHTPQTADHASSLTNLTTIVDDIPTTTEFNARTLPSGEYFDFTTDTASVNLEQILGTALTETGGAGEFAENVSTAFGSIADATKTQNDWGVPGTALTPQDVWEYATRTLSANTNLNDPAAGTIADAVWDELKSEHTTPDTFGDYLDNEVSEAASSSASSIADAVLEELLSEHTTAGTVGERLGRIPNAAAGGNGGLPTVDANNYLAGIQGTVNTLDGLNDPTAAAVATQVRTELTTELARIDVATSTRSSHSAADVNTAVEGGQVGTDASTAATQSTAANTAAQAIKTVTDFVNAMLEDDGSGGKQYTALAVENAPGATLSEDDKDDIAAAVAAVGTPISQVVIPRSRTFEIRPSSTGLTAASKTIKVAPGDIYAFDFFRDLPTNGRLLTFDSITITEGSAGGLTFDTDNKGVDKTQAKIKITGVTAGDYTVRVQVTYTAAFGGGTAVADVPITVVE